VCGSDEFFDGEGQGNDAAVERGPGSEVGGDFGSYAVVVFVFFVRGGFGGLRDSQFERIDELACLRRQHHGFMLRRIWGLASGGFAR